MIDIDAVLIAVRERYDYLKATGVPADRVSRQIVTLANVLVEAINHQLKVIQNNQESK